MEGIAVEYFTISIDPGSNEEKSESHSYISGDNEQDAFDSHAHMFHILKQFFELGILVYGMSTVWEDNNGCVKQYRCDLDIYLITVLSYSYGIIMNRTINSLVHVNNVVNGINATDKRYLKKMELVGKLSSNDTSKIGMIPSDFLYINVYTLSIIKKY